MELSIENSLGICYHLFKHCFVLWIAEKAKTYYDLITKSLQLVEAIILLFVTVYFLYNYNVKIDMTYPLVAVLLSGDLTELYSGSVKELGKRAIKRLLLIVSFHRPLSGFGLFLVSFQKVFLGLRHIAERYSTKYPRFAPRGNRLFLYFFLGPSKFYFLF